MIAKFFDPMSVDQLLKTLRRMESDADAESEDDVTGVQILMFTKGQDSTRSGNWVFYGPQDLVMNSTNQIQVQPIAGADEKSKEDLVRSIVTKGNRLISYATLLTQTGDQDVAVFRRDPTAAILGGSTPPPLPQGREAFLKSLPWQNAKLSLKSFIGLAQDGLHFFDDKGKTTAVLIESGANISTDGPGGSRALDPNWMSGTALEISSNPELGCDSRKFFGVVVPPWIKDRFGVRIGDFAIAINKDKAIACQAYDSGPPEKIGEISVALAWALGISPKPGDQLTKALAQRLGIALTPGKTLEPQQAEHLAATDGNDVKDLITLIFPQSGPGSPLSQAAIEAETGRVLAEFAGGAARAAAIGDLTTDPNVVQHSTRTATGSAQQHYDARTEANIASLQTDFADRVRWWLQVCRDKRLNPYIYSASRDPQRQQKLHDDFLAHQGGKAVAPQLSYHCYGRAFDWVNIRDPNAGDDGLEWNNDAVYRQGTSIAESDSNLDLTGIGEGDNDHIQDASFPSFRNLRLAEFGNFPNSPPV
jgi:hypothetical protein